MNTKPIIDAEELFQGNYKKAQKLVNKPDKVDKLLKDLKNKLKGLPILDDRLTFLPKMAMLLNSFIRKQYTKVPITSIFAIISAISYFVLPFDAIPDFIPVIGLLDDAAVVGLALHLIGKDLEDYMDWRIQVGLDKAEPIKE